MSVQGIPIEADLYDHVMIVTACDNRGFVSEGIRRDTHASCCTACGATRDLALTRIDDGEGKPYQALLCVACDQTFHALYGDRHQAPPEEAA